MTVLIIPSKGVAGLSALPWKNDKDGTPGVAPFL
jgi:hypothetical protein